MPLRHFLAVSAQRMDYGIPAMLMPYDNVLRQG